MLDREATYMRVGATLLSYSRQSGLAADNNFPCAASDYELHTRTSPTADMSASPEQPVQYRRVALTTQTDKSCYLPNTASSFH